MIADAELRQDNIFARVRENSLVVAGVAVLMFPGSDSRETLGKHFRAWNVCANRVTASHSSLMPVVATLNCA